MPLSFEAPVTIANLSLNWLDMAEEYVLWLLRLNIQLSDCYRYLGLRVEMN